MKAPGTRRCADDGGVALVEFALVLPVLMMLLLGSVSGATAWNQSQALGQGARVAGRYASTLPLPVTFDATTMAGWLDGVLDRSIDAAEGKMVTGIGGRSVCVAYVDPAGAAPDKTYSRRIDAAGIRTSATSVCISDSLSDTEKRVQILLERDSFLDIGLYRQPIQLRRSVVYRFEADGGI